jgi:hypothetical protein
MKKLLIVGGAVTGAALLARRRAAGGGVDLAQVVERMPENAPPKWCSATSTRSERTRTGSGRTPSASFNCSKASTRPPRLALQETPPECSTPVFPRHTHGCRLRLSAPQLGKGPRLRAPGVEWRVAPLLLERGIEPDRILRIFRFPADEESGRPEPESSSLA